MLLASASLGASIVFGQQLNRAKPASRLPGQRAIVFDERFSALRTQPDVKAPITQRLRYGHLVGLLSTPRGKPNGPRFYRVAASLNTRGWILVEAVARRGRVEDAERVMKLMAGANDDFTRARLARLCADEFRLTPVAPRALLALGQTAERAAERLSREAKRRLGDEEPDNGISKRDYLLNYAGLDRYNRLGITFDYDVAGERIIYDGAAYQELLRKYPRSTQADEARQRLAKLKSAGQG